MLFKKKDKKNNEQAEPTKDTAKRASVKEVIDGSFLTRDIFLKQMPFIFFLAVLAVVYIANRYHAEKIVRDTEKMKKELQDLRSETIASSSELMYISKQSKVAAMIKRQGIDLHESVEPPKKIVITNNQ